MISNKALGWGAALITGTLWGTSPVLSMPLLEYADSKVIVWLQYTIACLTLFVLLKVGNATGTIKKTAKFHLNWSNRYDVFWTAMCGIVGQGMYNYLSYLSLESITASENGVIHGLNPIAILFMGFLRHNVSFNFKQISAAMGAFIGIIILVLDPFANNEGFHFGHLLCFASVICFASNAYTRVYLASKYGSVKTMYHQFFCSSVGFGILIYFTGGSFSSAINLVNSVPAIVSICLLGIGVSALSYLIYLYAMNRIGVAGASVALNIAPLSSFILAVIILGEVVTTLKVLAILMVLFSMMMFMRFSRSESC